MTRSYSASIGSTAKEEGEIKSKDIDFANLATNGIYLVVVRIELNFMYSLRSGDRFFVGTNTERISRLRFGFRQDIFRLPDNKPVLRAKVAYIA